MRRVCLHCNGAKGIQVPDPDDPSEHPPLVWAKCPVCDGVGTIADGENMERTQRVSFVVNVPDLDKRVEDKVPRVNVRITVDAPEGTPLAVYDRACEKAKNALMEHVWGASAAKPVGEVVDEPFTADKELR